MRRVALQALVCLLIIGFAAQAVDTKKSAPAHDRSTGSPYWFHYPQFTDAEIRVAVNWFQDGLQAKRLHLAAIPATVAHEIHIGAKLTANMLKSLVTPPAELGAKLLPVPDGYQRLLAGSVLVLIKTDEELIVDTLPVGGR